MKNVDRSGQVFGFGWKQEICRRRGGVERVLLSRLRKEKRKKSTQGKETLKALSLVKFYPLTLFTNAVEFIIILLESCEKAPNFVF